MWAKTTAGFPVTRAFRAIDGVDQGNHRISADAEHIFYPHIRQYLNYQFCACFHFVLQTAVVISHRH
jgi:hypothetical protein